MYHQSILLVCTGLVLSPRSGIELGGTKIFIGGPCYVPKNKIVCRFNNTIQTSGVYLNPQLAYCITPPLYFAGLIQVELSLDGGVAFDFTGTFRSSKFKLYFKFFDRYTRDEGGQGPFSPTVRLRHS